MNEEDIKKRIQEHKIEHQEIAVNNTPSVQNCSILISYLQEKICRGLDYCDNSNIAEESKLKKVKYIREIFAESFCPFQDSLLHFDDEAKLVRLIFVLMERCGQSHEDGCKNLQFISKIIRKMNPFTVIQLFDEIVLRLNKEFEQKYGSSASKEVPSRVFSSRLCSRRVSWEDHKDDNILMILLSVAVYIAKEAYQYLGSRHSMTTMVDTYEFLLFHGESAILDPILVNTELLLDLFTFQTDSVVKRRLLLAVAFSAKRGCSFPRVSDTIVKILNNTTREYAIHLVDVLSEFFELKIENVSPALYMSMGNILAAKRNRDNPLWFVKASFVLNPSLHTFIAYFISKCIPVNKFLDNIEHGKDSVCVFNALLQGMVPGDDYVRLLFCLHIILQTVVLYNVGMPDKVINWAHIYIIENSNKSRSAFAMKDLESIYTNCLLALLYDILNRKASHDLHTQRTSILKGIILSLPQHVTSLLPDSTFTTREEEVQSLRQYDLLQLSASCASTKDNEDIYGDFLGLLHLSVQQRQLVAWCNLNACLMDPGIEERVFKDLANALLSSSPNKAFLSVISNVVILTKRFQLTENEICSDSGRMGTCFRDIFEKIIIWMTFAFEKPPKQYPSLTALANLVTHLADVKVQTQQQQHRDSVPKSIPLLMVVFSPWRDFFKFISHTHWINENFPSKYVLTDQNIPVHFRVKLLHAALMLIRKFVQLLPPTTLEEYMTSEASHRKVFSFAFRRILGLLWHHEESLQNEVAGNISVFLDGNSQDLGPGHFNNIILETMYSGGSCLANVKKFTEEISTILGKCESNIGTYPIMIHALGSIGCSANLGSALNEGDPIGVYLFKWVVETLVQEYIKRPATKLHTAGLQFHIRKQLRRMAEAHGFGTAKYAPHRMIVMKGLELFPSLISYLMSSDTIILTRSEKPINIFLFDLLEVDVEDMQFYYNPSKRQFDASDAPTPERYAIDFLQKTFQHVLPFLLKDNTNDAILVNIEKFINPREMKDHERLRHLVNRSYKSWISDMIDCTVSNNQNDSDAYRRVRHLVGDEQMNNHIMSGLQTVLASHLFQLVDSSGNPVEKTDRILSYIAKVSQSKTSSLPIIDTEAIASFLQHNFNYLTSLLTACVQDRFRSTAERVHALKCINRLLDLSKPYPSNFLEKYLSKVFATLKSALEVRTEVMIQREACSVIRKLMESLSEKALDENLNGLIVSLMPCLEAGETDASQDAVRVIHWALIDNKNIEAKKINEVCELLPTEHPSYTEKLREELQRQRKLSNTNSLGRLENLIKHLGHESDVVRFMALRETKKVLEIHSPKLRRILLSESDEPLLGPNITEMNREHVTDIVSRLISRLLRIARIGAVGAMEAPSGVAADTATLCGDCFGQLGAISPSLLNIETIQDNTRDPSENPESFNGHFDDLFAFGAHLMSVYLVPILRAAPTQQLHMQIAVAIQNVLKSYGDDKGNTKKKMKQHLENDLAAFEAIEPFWDSKYVITRTPKIPNPRCDGRFFGASVSFNDSIGDWFVYLVNQPLLSQPGKDEQTKLLKSLCILHSHLGATDLFQFCLPFLVKSFLLLPENTQSKEFADHIVDETINILNHVRGVIKEGESPMFASTKRSSSKLRKSAHMVFCLYDTLSIWQNFNEAQLVPELQRNMEDQQRPSPGELRSGKLHPNYFLQRIELRELSEAALNAEDFSRALRYFESYIRRKRSGNASNTSMPLNRQDLDFFYKLASAMEDEPDCIVAASAFRNALNNSGLDSSKDNSIDQTQTLKGSSLVQQILELEHGGKWDEAIPLYGQLLMIHSNNTTVDRKQFKESLVHVHNYLRCLRRGGHFEFIADKSESQRNPSAQAIAEPFFKEALWRLGKWDELKAILERDETNSLPAGVTTSELETVHADAVARQLYAMHQLRCTPKLQETDFEKHMKTAKLQAMDLLSSVAHLSYSRVYPLIFRLHSLYELQQGYDLLKTEALKNNANETNFSKADYFDGWDGRFDITAPQLRLRGELFALRQAMFNFANTPELSLRGWVQYAKAALDSKGLKECTIAQSYIDGFKIDEQTDLLSLSQLQSRFYLAQLQLFGEKNPLNALTTLEPKAMTPHKFRARLQEVTDKKHHALVMRQMFLLATNIMRENGHGCPSEILERYKALESESGDLELGQVYFAMAKYFEVVIHANEQTEFASPSKNSIMSHLELTLKLLNAYCKSLMHAHDDQYKYEGLSRFFTVWYSTSEKIEEAFRPVKNTAQTKNGAAVLRQQMSQKKVKELNEAQKSLKDILKELHYNVSPSLLYMAVSQLVSRASTPNEDMWNATKELLLSILDHYPSQVLWLVTGVTQYDGQRQRTHVQDLLKKFQSTSSENLRLVSAMESIFKSLIKIAKSNKSKSSRISTQESKIDLADSEWQRFTELRHMNVVMPVVRTLTTSVNVECPVSDLFDSMGKSMTILSSKQKPKKLTLVAKDGVKSSFLCKQEDGGDVRKDMRMMEFCSVVNRLFAAATDASNRNLRLVTFSVVCLNERCSFLEWVNNTSSLQAETLQCYAKKNPNHFLTTLANEFTSLQSAEETERVERFRILVTTGHCPPKFHLWFLKRFKDPDLWLEARTRFTRSCAVWSMVGHIIGLGDRHGLNILLNVNNGEVVHVDFDLLFDKGLRLQVPEVVPFRLTANMVDAMGISGVEGVFRCTSQVALEILRRNRDPLMHVLESFAVDPLVEWEKTTRGANKAQPLSNKENIQAGQAAEALKGVRERLSGVVRSRKSKPKQDAESDAFAMMSLSTAFQVEKLIEDATDAGDLSKMYFGWKPYL